MVAVGALIPRSASETRDLRRRPDRRQIGQRRDQRREFVAEQQQECLMPGAGERTGSHAAISQVKGYGTVFGTHRATDQYEKLSA